MAILTYNYQDLFTQVVKEFQNGKFLSELMQINTKHGLYNYLNTIKNMDVIFQRLVVMFLKTFLEKLDMEFRESPGRTKIHHIKSYHSRSIMTVFGLVTYTNIRENRAAMWIRCCKGNIIISTPMLSRLLATFPLQQRGVRFPHSSAKG